MRYLGIIFSVRELKMLVSEQEVLVHVRKLTKLIEREPRIAK